MYLQKFEAYIKNAVDNRTREQHNIIEATVISRTLRKFAGLVVLMQEMNETGKVQTKFSFLGFIFFVYWYSLYGYCGYISVIERQSILRQLYNTKLKHYGDTVEWVIGTVFVVIAMLTIPFIISGCKAYAQIIVDVDEAIRELNYNVNYAKCGQAAIVMDMFQFMVAAIHLISLWVTQIMMSPRIPYALIFQDVYVNALAMAGTSHYCFYLYLMKERYEKVNEIISTIPLISYKGKVKSIQIKDREISKTLRQTAKIYGMISKASNAGNKVFGLTIVASMLMSLFSIILNMFYLMEATAAKMFRRDFEKYIYFLVYIVWEIIYAVLVIFLSVHFCVRTKKKAKLTPHLTHDIINTNLSPAVNQVAMTMSMQLLHQSPNTDAAGLFRLEYALLLHGSRMVATFLVVLLRYAAD